MQGWEFSSSEVLVHPGIVKSLHLSLLRTFPPEDVWQFWKGVSYSGKDFQFHSDTFPASILNLQHRKLPALFILTVLCSMDSFLSHHGCISADFTRKLFIDFPPDRSWHFLYSLIAGKKLSPDSDLRREILRSCGQLWKTLNSNFILKTITTSKNDRSYTDTILLGIRNTERGLPAPPFDVDLWVVPWLKTLPLAFGLPEFEQVRIKADMRGVKEIVPNAVINANRKEKTAVIGKNCTFKDFLARLGNPGNFDGLSLKSDSEAIEIMQDCYCPRRKRTVLHKGCTYGAPVFVFQVTYSRSGMPDPWGIAFHLLKTAERKKILAKKFMDFQSVFLKYRAVKNEFYFDRQNDTMFVNGRYLTRNIPARILHKIVKKHVQDGTGEFERRWLLMDSSIVPDRQNPNLERRLQLLQSALMRKCPSVCLSRPSTGLFKLSYKGKILLRD